MQNRHTDSHRKPWPHKVGFHREKGDGIKRDHFWNPKWVELQWLATCICQQEPESLFCMCFYHHYTLHTKNKRNWQESSQKKKKRQIPHWPVTHGNRGAALHAYRGGSNRVYDCIISPLPHHLSTHQWTLEATTLEQTDQASLIHSPPRCLCQVIAGGKRKTDQYISHGPDR